MKNKIITGFILLSFIFFTSCAAVKPVTDLKPIVRTFNEILQATPNVITEEIPRYDGLKQKITTFRHKLNAGTPLSDQDWHLHDELLQAYISLKSITIDNKIQIPARSRKSVPIQTFCLNPNFGPPHQGEKFIWKTDNTEIPYFQDVIKYAIKHPEIAQSTIQSLIWNLKKETRWESYPKNMQSILLAIDPQVPFKLPSDVKEKIKTKVTNAVTDKLKEWGLWQSSQKIADWVKGEYRDFDSVQRQFLSLKSKFSLVPDNSLSQIPGTSLYADTQTNSYASHVIIFYNPTDAPVVIDLGKYYLQSTRPDVQRMGLKKIIPPELVNAGSSAPVFVDQDSVDNSDQIPAVQNGLESLNQAPIVQDLENVLYKDMLRLGVGFVPVVGDAADLYELFNGRDFVSGQELTWQERLLSGVGLIAGSGAGYRYALRAIHSPNQYIKEFEKGLSKVSGKTINLFPKSLNEAGNVISDSEKEVRNLKNIFPEDDIRKSGFTGIFTNEKRIGYHATSAESAELIKRNGFNLSNQGRLGGGGVYVNNSPEGALAEYAHYNGSGGVVLKIEYKPGLEYKLDVKQDRVHGIVPLKADTLTTESVRAAGTYNSLIRNETQKVLE